MAITRTAAPVTDLLTGEPPEWWADAACRDRPDVDFFAADPGPARAVCAACLVRRECLDWAVAMKVRFGVFGGLTPAERRGGRRRRTT
jgi:WhiB family transcriptional regulator, redox-sensing transcriptional regulator